MIEIGNYNKLKIVKEVEFGMYLDGFEDGEILLPKKYILEDFHVGDTIEVFIYNDSEDRLIATTQKPFAIINEFAYLEVVSVSKVGAFMNWGLLKDLLVPFSEQKVKMLESRHYLVYIYLDLESRRIVASAKLDKFVDNIPANYEVGEEVDVIISNETEIGYKVIINSQHWGLIFKNEVYQKLSIGQKIRAFVSNIREDEKIDISLFKPNIDKIDDNAEKIMKELIRNDGFLPVTDKSDTEDIYRIFGMSKKTFKKSIGNLYRRKLILLENIGIRIVNKS